jgi:hypothetical protein
MTEKKRGRPPEPVPQDVAEAILDWIASGRTLRDYCRQPGKPAWRTVYHWIDKDEDFVARFARARQMGCDAIAEECLDIIDREPPATDRGIDRGYVDWVKSKAWIRLQLLAKWYPARYGDRVAVDGSLTLKTDEIEAAHERARQLACRGKDVGGEPG